MAKITGPLLSMKVSGKIGERLTFSARASGQQARFQRAQKDVITSERAAQRLKYSDAVAAWNSLEDETKTFFKSLAVGYKMTGFNFFVKLYLTEVIVDGDASIYGFRNYGIIIYGKQI